MVEEVVVGGSLCVMTFSLTFTAAKVTRGGRKRSGAISLKARAAARLQGARTMSAVCSSRLSGGTAADPCGTVCNLLPKLAIVRGAD